MASAKTNLQLQERVPLPRTAWKLADLAVLFLLLALLAHRVSSLMVAGGGGAAWCWVAAFICEAWFTVVWLINMNAKWNPVRFDTHPERLAQRTDELPAVDMFVTTADPKLEPPVVTVNTVLSLDYPAGKLTCYVSDDGCSAVTCYALREAAEFAKLWVPFCKKHGVGVRAPFVYFSSAAAVAAADDAEFLRAWTFMKNEYEELVRRIENAEEDSLVRRGDDGEFAEFVGADRRNHLTIIKVALHAMCLLLGFHDDVHSGFVQVPQKFYGALKDDPFGNQMQVLFEMNIAFTVGKSCTACHQTPPPPA